MSDIDDMAAFMRDARMAYEESIGFAEYIAQNSGRFRTMPGNTDLDPTLSEHAAALTKILGQCFAHTFRQRLAALEEAADGWESGLQ
jgi:hypothetical protein